MGLEDIIRFPTGFPLNVMLPHHSGTNNKARVHEASTMELHQETRVVWWTCTFPNCRWKNHTIYTCNDTTNRRRTVWNRPISQGIKDTNINLHKTLQCKHSTYNTKMSHSTQNRAQWRQQKYVVKTHQSEPKSLISRLYESVTQWFDANVMSFCIKLECK